MTYVILEEWVAQNAARTIEVNIGLYDGARDGGPSLLRCKPTWRLGNYLILAVSGHSAAFPFMAKPGSGTPSYPTSAACYQSRHYTIEARLSRLGHERTFDATANRVR